MESLQLLIGSLALKAISTIDASMLILMILATIVITLVKVWFITPLVMKLRRDE